MHEEWDYTEGIRRLYEYIRTKAEEGNGKLDEIDVAYTLGALNMWLVNHEMPQDQKRPIDGPHDIKPKWWQR